MHFGYHHYRNHHTARGKTGPWVKFLDKAVYISAFFGPIMLVPQLLKIWQEKNAAGVSLLTWISYLAGAVFWLFYGLVHKEKPIIVANISFGILTLLIVVGILIYG